MPVSQVDDASLVGFVVVVVGFGMCEMMMVADVALSLPTASVADNGDGVVQVTTLLLLLALNESTRICSSSCKLR